MLVEKLYENNELKPYELKELIEENSAEPSPKLLNAALSVRKKYYGNGIYFRGLIEFSNYCKNDCYYCGIRRGNVHAHRYRLTKEKILKPTLSPLEKKHCNWLGLWKKYLRKQE